MLTAVRMRKKQSFLERVVCLININNVTASFLFIIDYYSCPCDCFLLPMGDQLFFSDGVSVCVRACMHVDNVNCMCMCVRSCVCNLFSCE